MPTWIALFRGINVGGRNRLPMKDLVRDLETLGLMDIRTYIQSGNVVFRSRDRSAATLEKKIADAIEKRHGFRPHIVILSVDQLRAAGESNPFPEAESEPKSLHLFFLASPPAAPDLEALKSVKAPSERFHLAGDVFYLHAPAGIGRSRLAASVEKRLGVPATARNWRTVRELIRLAGVD
jgi:uncharacterized protein (DUF1697 family)